MRTRVHLELPLLPDFEAAVCDLMEQTDLKTISFVPETELCRKGQTLEFEMKPYEIFFHPPYTEGLYRKIGL